MTTIIEVDPHPMGAPAATRFDPADPWPMPVSEEASNPHTDHANAHRIVRAFGTDMLFVPGLGWLTFAPPWRADELAVRKAAARLGRIVAREARAMLDQAASIEDEAKRTEALKAGEARLKWARTSEMRATITAALAMAEPLLSMPIDRIDADPMLLACRNGVVDLSTGRLRPHRRTDFITQAAAVSFDERKRAPTWERFVSEVFGGDAELIEFMQRFFGYALTGLTREHMLVVAHGSGSNGKTTLFETVRTMLGSYGKTAAPGLLIARKGERHPTEIMDLLGARLVLSAETGEGGRLAEDLVKSLTGGDGLKGRLVHQNFVDFRPTHKLVLSTNHRPVVTGQDYGIWRRLKLIPFNQTFEGERKDATLPAKLQRELPGILNWCLAGLARYQREGFNRCATIEQASAQYREDSDVLGQFIEDECITAPGYDETAGELYRVFRQWCAAAGIHPMAKRTFGMRLEERGFASRKSTGGVRKWLGLKLGTEAPKSWAA
jgi:putative DNA primase/helicase